MTIGKALAAKSLDRETSAAVKEVRTMFIRARAKANEWEPAPYQQPSDTYPKADSQ